MQAFQCFVVQTAMKTAPSDPGVAIRKSSSLHSASRQWMEVSFSILKLTAVVYRSLCFIGFLHVSIYWETDAGSCLVENLTYWPRRCAVLNLKWSQRLTCCLLKPHGGTTYQAVDVLWNQIHVFCCILIFAATLYIWSQVSVQSSWYLCDWWKVWKHTFNPESKE